jgi:hypothetical protein
MQRSRDHANEAKRFSVEDRCGLFLFFVFVTGRSCRNIVTCLNDDTDGLASGGANEGDFAIVNTHMLASVLSRKFAKEIFALSILMLRIRLTTDQPQAGHPEAFAENFLI